MDEKTPPLLPLLKYAKRVGWTRNQAYAAVRESVLPTVRVGSLIFVPVLQADRRLGLTDEAPPEAEQAAA